MEDKPSICDTTLLHLAMHTSEAHTKDSLSSNMDKKLVDPVDALTKKSIQHDKAHGEKLPVEALMHDRAAIVPALVISPHDESAVQEVTKTLYDLKIFDDYSVSIRSGGHGYFNGASCSGIMINLSLMSGRTSITSNQDVIIFSCLE